MEWDGMGKQKHGCDDKCTYFGGKPEDKRPHN